MFNFSFTCKALLGAALALSAAFVLPASASAADLRGVAVILIHGKGGGQGPLLPLAGALKRDGALVLLPNMSWKSGYRTYQATLAEVEAQVGKARADGARKIVLAGHSMGANLSLGYSANSGGIAGIVALAPGHRPDFIATRSGDSLARAREMVATGRGGQTARFVDYNQGRTFPVSTTADAYLSFFEPGGPADRAAQARGVRAPVLWVVGRGDRPAMTDRATFSTGTRIEVDADHGSTPRVAVEQVVDWISKL